MVAYFRELLFYISKILRSKYKWLLILFTLWLYRVDFIPADGGGLAKGLQVFTVFGMLFWLLNKKSSIPNLAYSRTNLPIKSLLWLYTYAVISTIWSLIPTFAFFLSFQNIVLIFLLVWAFTQFRGFSSIERFFLFFAVGMTIFEVVFERVLHNPSLFIHYLPGGSASAICISYCVGELLANNGLTPKRKTLLKCTFILSMFILVTSTSSGANASAILGFAVALFLSGRILYASILVLVGLFLYLNPHLIEDLILMVMPGKTIDTLQSSSGRTALWDILYELAAQKPLFGWGYACIERAVTLTGFDAADAHNNYLGIYGSLGIVGCVFLAVQMISSVLYSLKRRLRPGYTGLICAFCCAILNGYSYGFLSGKACSITVIYFSLVILTFIYSKVRTW